LPTWHRRDNVVLSKGTNYLIPVAFCDSDPFIDKEESSRSVGGKRKNKDEHHKGREENKEHSTETKASVMCWR